MKKILKTTCAALLLATSVTSFAGIAEAKEVKASLPTIGSTYSAEGTFINQVKVVGLRDVTLGETNYTIPTATMADATLESTVVTYNGKNVAMTDGKINIEYIGTYNVTYTFTKGSNTYSATVSFKSTKQNVTISNESAGIPLKLPANFTADLKLPVPTVKDKEGEIVTGATIETVVKAPGNVALSVDSNNKVDFTNATQDSKLILGIYSVKYIAKIGGVKVAETAYTNFEVVEDYSITELRYEYLSAKPTSLELGESVDLPKVSGINRISATQSETVNVLYSVKTIKHTAKDGTETNVTIADVMDDMKFTADQEGTYTIKYEVKDFLGNTSTYENDIVIAVQDTKAPVIKVVEAYALNATTHTEALHKLPSGADPEAEIIVMPMWAEDEISPDVANGLKMSIRIEDRSTYTDIYNTDNFESTDAKYKVVNKELVFNKTDAYTINTETQIDTGIDLVAGKTYRVYYSATDKNNNPDTVHYDIKVSNDFAYDVQPTVEFNTVFPSAVQNGDEVTFEAVTFSDKNDERLEKKVEYRYGTNDWEELEALDDGSYKIKVNTAEDSLSIRAIAYNNGYYTNAISDFKTEKTVTIDILDIVDSTVPVVTNSGVFVTGHTFTQNDEVTLPSITVEDDKVDYVSISTKVQHIDGETVTDMATYGGAIIRTGDTKQLQGVKTLASLAGSYRAIFTIKDAGNNIVIQYFDYDVAEDVTAIDRRFTNLPTTLVTGDLELGEKLTLPTPTIIKAEEETASYYVQAVGGDCIINNSYFEPLEAKTYTLKYIGKAGDTDIFSKEFTVTVKDSTDPTYIDVDIQPSATKGDIFTIPVMSVDDGNGTGIDLKESYVSVSSSRTTTVKFTFEELYSSVRTRTLAKEEEYTVKYYIIDNSGNDVIKEYKIAVGDTISPVITLANDILPATIKKGDTVTIDLNDITVSDNKTELETSDVVISLWNTTTDTEVNALENQGAGKYVYKINNAGTYKFTFVVTDEAGHSNNECIKTFTVDAKANEGTDKTEVLGTILIVVSVLVLAGVIVYFVITKRRNDKIYK